MSSKIRLALAGLSVTAMLFTAGPAMAAHSKSKNHVHQSIKVKAGNGGNATGGAGGAGGSGGSAGAAACVTGPCNSTGGAGAGGGAGGAAGGGAGGAASNVGSNVNAPVNSGNAVSAG